MAEELEWELMGLKERVEWEVMEVVVGLMEKLQWKKAWWVVKDQQWLPDRHQ